MASVNENGLVEQKPFKAVSDAPKDPSLPKVPTSIISKR